MKPRGSEAGRRPSDVAKNPEHKESRRAYGLALMALGLALSSADKLRAALPDLSTKPSSPKSVDISREDAEELRHRAETLERLFTTIRDLTQESETEPAPRTRTFDGLELDADFLGARSENPGKTDRWTQNFLERQEFVAEALLGAQEELEIEIDGDYLALSAEDVEVTSPLEESFPEGFKVSVDLSYQIEESDEEGILTLVRTDNGYESTDVLLSADHEEGFTQDELREAIRTDFQRQVVLHAVETELAWETRMNHPEGEGAEE